MTIVPRLAATLAGSEFAPTGRDVWGDTWIPLSGELSLQRWRDVITGNSADVERAGGRTTLRVSAILDALPVALLVAEG